MEHDFMAFSSIENQYHMLNGTGSKNDPIALEGGDSDSSELDSEDMDLEDKRIYANGSDMDESQNMTINVEADERRTTSSMVPKAQVMFTESHAVTIYKVILNAGFLLPLKRAVRYCAQSDGVSPDSASNLSLAPSLTSGQPSVSSTSSRASSGEIQAVNTAGRDYVFSFGKYAGQRFLDVPENYLRTIGGQLDVYEGRHAGLREAFEYYRPGQARSAAPARVPVSQPQRFPVQPRLQPPAQPPTQARPLLPVAPKRRNVAGLSETWTFQKGIHKGKRLAEVPENYIRTLEGMPSVRKTWQGFEAAVADFNQRTGRQGKTRHFS